MEIKLTSEDIKLLQATNDFELDSQEKIEKFEIGLKEDIDYWSKIQTADIRKMHLGIYYVAYLLGRVILQDRIDEVSKNTAQKIEKALKPTDDFFKKNMKPKNHYYDELSFKKDKTYFWQTHSIHPIDLSKGLEKRYAHPEAIKLLSHHDFFWEQKSPYTLFGDKVGKIALREFRNWRVWSVNEPFDKCIDWNFDCFEFERKKYSLIYPSYERQGRVFDKNMVCTIFGQLADEGEIEPEGFEIGSIALQRMIFHEKKRLERLKDSVFSIFKKRLNQKEKYSQNLMILLELLDEIKEANSKTQS